MLIDVIEEAQSKVDKAYSAWMFAVAELDQAKARRNDCEHSFMPALLGYEHEGGYCNKCGINQVFAECQKIGKFK